ncbi:hypothetical protein H0902_19345 [Microcystis aeruginosa BLCCF108]|uniref:Uncharacterized protein n=1 Tax=Microcystis aeruginosa BLCC-F108 TaxID=2755317 RepID=A0A841US91_MICAE|nr:MULTISPECIES: hypothetical protein [Microcystis]MBC1192825.1 hypothetical protein [Microcystis aeruginosa BLCC-F108]
MATTKENYYFLHNLLAAGKWEEADRTTYTIISGLAGGTVLRGFDNREHLTFAMSINT